MRGAGGRLAWLSVLALLLSRVAAAEPPACGDGPACAPPTPGVSASGAARPAEPPAGVGEAKQPTNARPGAPQRLAEPAEGARDPGESGPVPAAGAGETLAKPAADAPREPEPTNATEGGQVTEPAPAAAQGGGSEPRLPAGEDAAQAPPEASAEDEFEERHNFALAKDGAKVVAANKEARKAGALLDADADTFLKNECKADKWVIVELSQVTKMDTLLLSQNELYSSRVREFELRGRQSHPRAEGADYGKALSASAWQLLGRFNASNAKGSQAFKLERPAWVKYLQLRQLSHYGSEAVCALNALCVYGQSAAEDLEARLHLGAAAEPEEPAAGAAAEQPPAGPHALGPPLELLAPAAPATDAGGGEGQAPAEQQPAAAQEAGGGRPQADAEAAAAAADAPPAAPAVPGPGSPSSASQQPQPADTPADAPGLMLPSKLPEAAEGAAEEHSRLRTSPEAAGAEPVVSPTEGALPSNSAGSAASRHGGSLYDMLVQELKAIKVQQKAGARTLQQLQRNLTAVMGGFALELDRLAARVRLAHHESPALLPGPAAPGGGELQPPQCRANVTVVRPPTELELLQQEVAALRQAVAASRRQADALLLAAAAASLVGGIGAGLLLARCRGPLPRLLLCCTAVPPALAAAAWVAGGAFFGQTAR